MPKHRHVDPPFITGKKCFACGGEIPLCHPLTRYCSVKCQNFVRYAVQLTTARKLQAMSNKVRCANCHFIKTMERRMMKRALTPEQETRIRDIVERLVAFGNLKSRA